MNPSLSTVPNSLLPTVLNALEDIKAKNIEVLDVRALTSLFDTLVIASADSTRQTRALAHHVADEVRNAGRKVLSMEGLQSGEWILVDLGSIIVHLMQPMIRDYYDLSSLWKGPLRPASLIAQDLAP
ncbi:ribosome silencing factor [Ferrovum myxofaciens]|jgi:ribosome-associated protein|uniref:ribosome silencing factor n=1 Tax=Ferrovum myxofaciens TaxID=416213 RepID=UPI0004E0E72F|nr:ribosome silencing factor [Ferrovum myxofaciens]NDU88563.1 ribosome silencing factor [Ferrovum sp.]